MAFDNKTNRGRVKKIIETLDLIQKSAKSNNAAPEKISEMLAPVQVAIGSTKPDESRPNSGDSKASVKPVQTTKQRVDMELAEACREAPIWALPRVMAVIMNRVDELIHDND